MHALSNQLQSELPSNLSTDFQECFVHIFYLHFWLLYWYRKFEDGLPRQVLLLKGSVRFLCLGIHDICLVKLQKISAVPIRLTIVTTRPRALDMNVLCKGFECKCDYYESNNKNTETKQVFFLVYINMLTHGFCFQQTLRLPPKIQDRLNCHKIFTWIYFSFPCLL